MPGRFALDKTYQDLSDAFTADLAPDLPALPMFNICPTHDVPALISTGGTRSFRPMRWGFIPAWASSPTERAPLINARSESVAVKPAFRQAVRSRRCVVPATGYFEWTKDEAGQKTPYFVRSVDGSPLLFAGLWQTWRDWTTLALITCPPNNVVGQLHHRMPVLIQPEDLGLWLGEKGHGAAVLMRSAADDVLGYHPVDRAVNSNRAEGPDLIQPIHREEQWG